MKWARTIYQSHGQDVACTNIPTGVYGLRVVNDIWHDRTVNDLRLCEFIYIRIRNGVRGLRAAGKRFPGRKCWTKQDRTVDLSIVSNSEHFECITYEESSVRKICGNNGEAGTFCQCLTRILVIITHHLCFECCTYIKNGRLIYRIRSGSCRMWMWMQPLYLFCSCDSATMTGHRRRGIFHRRDLAAYAA